VLENTFRVVARTVVAVSMAGAAVADEVGGYARCGADYVAIPASLGHPDGWGFAQRKESQERFGYDYSPEEIDAATASDAVFEDGALADGLFIVDCSDVLLPTDGEWEYFEDNFMD